MDYMLKYLRKKRRKWQWHQNDIKIIKPNLLQSGVEKFCCSIAGRRQWQPTISPSLQMESSLSSLLLEETFFSRWTGGNIKHQILKRPLHYFKNIIIIQLHQDSKFNNQCPDKAYWKLYPVTWWRKNKKLLWRVWFLSQRKSFFCFYFVFSYFVAYTFIFIHVCLFCYKYFLQ